MSDFKIMRADEYRRFCYSLCFIGKVEEKFLSCEEAKEIAIEIAARLKSNRGKWHARLICEYLLKQEEKIQLDSFWFRI